MHTAIPIKNIYYLLVYSWNRLNEGEVIDVSGINCTELVDLFASVLIRGTKHIMRRGLAQGYEIQSNAISGVRGRVKISHTVRKLLIQKGQTHCEYDEISPNTLENQILKSTLIHLSKVKNIDAQLRTELLSLSQKLRAIETPQLKSSLFRKVQLHGNSRYYKFLLKICELVANSLLVDKEGDGYKFKDFLRDERQMARVFEEFLFNFYLHERPDLSIKKEKIKWDASAKNPNDLTFLPSMETDISLRSAKKTLIVDAKYYKETLSKFYDASRIHSGNLYQLFAYLKNLEEKNHLEAPIEGMLLYPTVQDSYRLDYDIHGHRVQICTVNLAEHWSTIKEELKELISHL